MYAANIKLASEKPLLCKNQYKKIKSNTIDKKYANVASKVFLFIISLLQNHPITYAPYIK